MITTKGVVLHRINYKESSIIATIYTRDFGRQSYVVNGVRKAKSKVSLQLFEPATLLDMEVYPSNKPGLQRAKEFNLMHPEQGLNTDFYRQTIRMFCAELIYKATTDDDAIVDLYSFLETTLLALEHDSEIVADFAPKFIVHLSRYVGFWPENNFSSTHSLFNLKEGRFESALTFDPAHLSPENSQYLAAILGTNFVGKIGYSTNGQSRGEFLEAMIRYYDMHLDKQLNIKSLEVIQSVFSF